MEKPTRRLGLWYLQVVYTFIRVHSYVYTTSKYHNPNLLLGFSDSFTVFRYYFCIGTVVSVVNPKLHKVQRTVLLLSKSTFRIVRIRISKSELVSSR